MCRQRVKSPPKENGDPMYPKLQAYPPGFRMLAGNPKLRTYDENSLAQQAVSHVCLGGNEPEQGGFPKGNCKNGLRSQIYFPSCWNGVDLDSDDHKKHMAYPNGSHYDSGVCPTTHPVPMISIFYEFIFSTGDFANDWYGNSQPFVYSFGDPTGYGFHADFVSFPPYMILKRHQQKILGQWMGCCHFTERH